MIAKMSKPVKKKRKATYRLLKNSILFQVLTRKTLMLETLRILLLQLIKARRMLDKIWDTNQICKIHQTYHLPHQSIMTKIRTRGVAEKEINLNHLLQQESETNKFVDSFDKITKLL